MTNGGRPERYDERRRTDGSDRTDPTSTVGEIGTNPIVTRSRTVRWVGQVTGPNSKLSFAAAGTMAATLFGVGGRFVIQVLMAQLLGTAKFGLFVTLRRWAELLAVLPNRGQHGAVVRFLPDYESSGAWPAYRLLFRRSLRRTMLAAVAVGLAGTAVGLWAWSDQQLAVLLAMAAIPAWAMLLMLQAILQAQHHYAAASLVMHVVQPLALGVGLGAVWIVGAANGLEAMLAVLLASILVSVAISAYSTRAGAASQQRSPTVSSTTPETTDLDLEQEIGLWDSAAKQFYAGQLAIAVTGSADVLILAMFVSSSDVALYAIASRIALLGRLVNAGLEAIVAPRISSAWGSHDIGGIQRAVNGAISISTLPTIGLAMVLVAFRGPILGLVGDDYREAGSVMVVLLIGNIVQALTGPCGYVVSLTDNEDFHARTMMAAAAFLVTLCLLVAAPGGIVAVAIVTTIVTIGWNATLVWFARRRVGVSCYPTVSMLRSLGTASS